jgi:DNA-directed RNA polymerase subunit RPC12/RpoP
LVENITLNVAGGHVKFDHDWFRCLICDTTFRETETNQGNNCPVCHAESINHINRTLHQSSNIPKAQRNAMGELGYCVCPSCGQKQNHVAGVPCKSLMCEKCQVYYVRENSVHHNNITRIKNQQEHK